MQRRHGTASFRNLSPVVGALLCVAGCGTQTPPEPTADTAPAKSVHAQNPAEKKPKPEPGPDDIRISSKLADSERQRIVLDRVDKDIHQLAETWPDKNLRILMETIAADSGVHPKSIPLDVPLSMPPVSMEAADIEDLQLTIEDVFGILLGDDPDKSSKLTPQGIYDVIKAK